MCVCMCVYPLFSKLPLLCIQLPVDINFSWIPSRQLKLNRNYFFPDFLFICQIFQYFAF